MHRAARGSDPCSSSTTTCAPSMRCRRWLQAKGGAQIRGWADTGKVGPSDVLAAKPAPVGPGADGHHDARRMDGYEAMRPHTARTKRPQGPLPIVALTAKAMKGRTNEKCFAAGATALSAPNPIVAEKAVGRCLARALLEGRANERAGRRGTREFSRGRFARSTANDFLSYSPAVDGAAGVRAGAGRKSGEAEPSPRLAGAARGSDGRARVSHAAWSTIFSTVARPASCVPRPPSCSRCPGERRVMPVLQDVAPASRFLATAVLRGAAKRSICVRHRAGARPGLYERTQIYATDLRPRGALDRAPERRLGHTSLSRRFADAYRQSGGVQGTPAPVLRGGVWAALAISESLKAQRGSSSNTTLGRGPRLRRDGTVGLLCRNRAHLLRARAARAGCSRN